MHGLKLKIFFVIIVIRIPAVWSSGIKCLHLLLTVISHFGEKHYFLLKMANSVRELSV